MQCIEKVLDLFEGPTCCSATSLAVAAFVAGMLFAFILCKLVRPCACRKNVKPSRRVHAKEERPFEKRKPHPAPADGSVEIYVGNLSYDMTEDQLRNEFEAYGVVNSARLITNRYNGKSKGFGFVQMPNRAEAEKACAALNDKDIMGRKMKCNEAKNLI
jgi:RNA recognition motif-containing protein